jgi:glycosyltransferase involved in cell wall biosynthesis
MKTGVMLSLSPTSSSSLPQYVAEAVSPYAHIEHVCPQPRPVLRYLNALKTFHPKRQIWRDRFEAESDHRLRVWHDNSRQIQASETVRKADFILQEGLHFNGYPEGYSGKRCVYLHGTLSMLLDSPYRCDMWIPPAHEVEAWMALEKSFLRATDTILIGSSFLRNVLRTRYGISDEKIHFVGTGVPPFGFPSPPPRASRGKRLLFVGKDFERKGGEVLLRAFAELKKRHVDAELAIVGPFKVDMPLPAGVRLVGRITNRAELARLYTESDVFVMPTLHESFGFVYLEAMHFNLPCVGTRMFAIPEIIADSETGVIVEPNNVQELARALSHLLEDPQRAFEMGLAGKARLDALFSWDRVGKNIARQCEIAKDERTNSVV